MDCEFLHLMNGCINVCVSVQTRVHTYILSSFGNKHVTPRTLTSGFLGNLVCVEGIVTKGISVDNNLN